MSKIWIDDLTYWGWCVPIGEGRITKLEALVKGVNSELYQIYLAEYYKYNPESKME